MYFVTARESHILPETVTLDVLFSFGLGRPEVGTGAGLEGWDICFGSWAQGR